NPTEGLFDDLAESFKQKERETPEVRDRWELFWTDVKHLAALLGWKEEVAAVTLKWFAEDLIREANPDPIVDSMVSRLINTIKSERKKVLAIAHSQGNLFVNSVFDGVHKVVPTESIKVVHVAPASGTLRGPYTLADIDNIIRGVSLIGPTPTPNVHLDASVFGLQGHNFLSVYMNNAFPNLARQQIVADINSQLAALQDPPVAGLRPFVYVANEGSNSVTIIDPTTVDILGVLSVGRSPFGIGVSPDGTQAYVANRDSNNVSV